MSHNDEALTLVQRGESISIQSVEEYKAAAEFLKGATALDRSIKLHYHGTKDAPGPTVMADRLHDQLLDAEKIQRRPIQTVIERVKGLMLGWDAIQQQLATAQQKQLQAQANQKGGAVIPQMQVKADTPKVGGISGRSTWKCIVDDRDKVPYEYLIPDQAALDTAATRMKGEFNIPGCHAVEDKNIVVKGV